MWNENPTLLFHSFLLAFHLFIMFLLLVKLPSVVTPCIEGNSIVHHLKEWIYRFTATYHFFEEHFVIFCFFLLILGAQR